MSFSFRSSFSCVIVADYVAVWTQQQEVKKEEAEHQKGTQKGKTKKGKDKRKQEKAKEDEEDLDEAEEAQDENEKIAASDDDRTVEDAAHIPLPAIHVPAFASSSAAVKKDKAKLNPCHVGCSPARFQLLYAGICYCSVVAIFVPRYVAIFPCALVHPFASAILTHSTFCFLRVGPQMLRDLGCKPDPRVAFCPDTWQRKVLGSQVFFCVWLLSFALSSIICVCVCMYQILLIVENPY